MRPPTYLVEVIREVRPQVLVTYDEFGNYGHPDHIQAHRVATYAAALAAVPSYKPDLGEAWDIPKIYWSAMAESRFRATLVVCATRATPRRSRGWSPTADFGPFVTPDENISARVDGSDLLDTKLAALSAASQPGRRWTARSSPAARTASRCGARSSTGSPRASPVRWDADGWESDLFAGL